MTDVVIADIKKEEVAKIKETAKRYKHISKLILFGSSIREDCRPSSDIDLCIIVRGKNSSPLTSMFLIECSTVSDIDIMVYTDKEFSENKSCVVSEIKKNGLIIYEGEK